MENDYNETNQRCDTIPGIRCDNVYSLEDMLHRHHTYVSSFRHTIERMSESEEDYKVIIKADKTPNGEHERRFNAPVTNEVPILIAGQHLKEETIFWKNVAVVFSKSLKPIKPMTQFSVHKFSGRARPDITLGSHKQT
ncbi:hypothetical protein LOD99_8418 [Oopsacas minuta]|uniref:Uncharacterized protein n=1 Tax=Oopsacas minuta TaxID=111878 RepID=A0AAV7JH92_9METZ|nr:hypothetical protein LOD99_8418 [Oopsacas minuta]